LQRPALGILSWVCTHEPEQDQRLKD